MIRWSFPRCTPLLSNATDQARLFAVACIRLVRQFMDSVVFPPCHIRENRRRVNVCFTQKLVVDTFLMASDTVVPVRSHILLGCRLRHEMVSYQWKYIGGSAAFVELLLRSPYDLRRQQVFKCFPQYPLLNVYPVLQLANFPLSRYALPQLDHLQIKERHPAFNRMSHCETIDTLEVDVVK